jgi:hypothetical protein
MWGFKSPLAHTGLPTYLRLFADITGAEGGESLLEVRSVGSVANGGRASARSLWPCRRYRARRSVLGRDPPTEHALAAPRTTNPHSASRPAPPSRRRDRSLSVPPARPRHARSSISGQLRYSGDLTVPVDDTVAEGEHLVGILAQRAPADHRNLRGPTVLSVRVRQRPPPSSKHEVVRYGCSSMGTRATAKARSLPIVRRRADRRVDNADSRRIAIFNGRRSELRAGGSRSLGSTRGCGR